MVCIYPIFFFGGGGGQNKPINKYCSLVYFTRTVVQGCATLFVKAYQKPSFMVRVHGARDPVLLFFFLLVL